VPDSTDKTVLLTSAGVQQMLPFFQGVATPPAPRLASIQKCIRTTPEDFEEVGDVQHHSFFEMMGNFSVNDYYKREAVRFSWELCTRRLTFDPERIWATIYTGDDEAREAWYAVGMPDERIVELADNWWGPAGAYGPCGPDSELFYDRGEQFGCGRPECKPGCDCERFLEFWNNVFTDHIKEPDGTIRPGDRKNIDTGAGLERWCMLLQGVNSDYETDIWRPIVDSVAEKAGVALGQAASTDRALRIIGDHVRASVFLLCDGVQPSKEGRGYVLRRLVRRAVRYGRLIGLTEPFVESPARAVLRVMGGVYPELHERWGVIAEGLRVEEARFLTTLERGLALLNEMVEDVRRTKGDTLPGDRVFTLYDTHGFPLELTEEIAREHGLTVDLDGYNAALEAQRERARSHSAFGRQAGVGAGTYSEIARGLAEPVSFLGYETLESTARVVALVVDDARVEAAHDGDTVGVILDRTPFYSEAGGQVGDKGTLAGPIGVVDVVDTRRLAAGLVVHFGTVRGGTLRAGDEVRADVDPHLRTATLWHHSGTHLLHQALKDVLGPTANQEGSLVEPGRLRFDFSYQRAMTPDELAEVERRVNEEIRRDLPVTTEIMDLAEARKTGAMALFSEKYGERVRVVSMGSYSKELCGGTHVGRTGEIGAFFITGEGSTGTGIRRIEAVAGQAALDYARGFTKQVQAAARLIGATPEGLLPRLESMAGEVRGLRQQVEKQQQQLAGSSVEGLLRAAERRDGWSLLVADAGEADVARLRELSDAAKSRLTPCVILLAGHQDGHAAFTAAVSDDLVKKGITARDLIGAVNTVAGSRGGGSPTWAQAARGEGARVEAALEAARAVLKGVGSD
jgi:alanyl-tRNA synthetase